MSREPGSRITKVYRMEILRSASMHAGPGFLASLINWLAPYHLPILQFLHGTSIPFLL